MANLAVIEGGGSGGLYSVSASAEEFLACLPQKEQEAISEGFERAYGKILKLLVDMKLSSYSPVLSSIALTILTDRTVMIDVNGYALCCSVELCQSSFRLNLLSIRNRDALSAYQRLSL